jgi:hypothetical protein
VQIGYDSVAISNTPTADQIHSMLDRHRAAALPFSGSSLLEQHYHDVPLLSFAWGVGQIGLPFSDSGAIHIFGVALPLEPDSTIIASVAPALPVPGELEALRFKVEEIATSEDKAASQAADLATLVTLVRALSLAPPPSNPPSNPDADNPGADSPGATSPTASKALSNDALKELIKTTTVTQHGERVVVTGTISATTLGHL